jgi:anaerobic selenocysteine-containing dehydrogenase
MRERRSENSWMHNAPALAGGRPKHAARMHPKDAAPLGLADGDLVRLVSKSGAIELPVLLTDDLRAGVVAVPHGWGHKGTGGWRTANQNPGANVNELASSDPADLEPLVGMSHLSGIPVRAEALVLAEPSAQPS